MTATANPSFAHITPNWFAAVMGTGIVSVAAASLSSTSAALTVVATTFWLLSSIVLCAVVGAFAVHWINHRELAIGYAHSPTMFPFYGAVAMAVLTVGSATGTTGRQFIGEPGAVAISCTLWVVGTAIGLGTYFVMTRRLVRDPDRTTAMPFWLMPVVPPMVSATNGATITSFLPEGSMRTTGLVCCYVMFLMALAAAVFVIVTVGRRFARNHARGIEVIAGNAIPSLWIPLGVVGQSIGASNLLATTAHGSVSDRSAAVLHNAGLGYGAVVGTLGICLFVAVAAVTVRALRRGLDFSLGWWSFTFPIGACAVGASAFASASGSHLVLALAIVLLAVLIPIWTTVAARTVGSIRSGRLPAAA